MYQRHCEGDRRHFVTPSAAERDTARRLEEYAAGYADRQAEQRG